MKNVPTVDDLTLNIKLNSGLTDITGWENALDTLPSIIKVKILNV